MHGLLSSQLIAVKTQPVAGTQLSVVQRLLSLQTVGAPGWQMPFTSQVSVPLQRSASAHEVPEATGVFTQPLIWSQLSAVHGLPSSQVRGAPVQVKVGSLIAIVSTFHPAAPRAHRCRPSIGAGSAGRSPTPEIDLHGRVRRHAEAPAALPFIGLVSGR